MAVELGDQIGIYEEHVNPEPGRPSVVTVERLGVGRVQVTENPPLAARLARAVTEFNVAHELGDAERIQAAHDNLPAALKPQR